MYDTKGVKLQASIILGHHSGFGTRGSVLITLKEVEDNIMRKLRDIIGENNFEKLSRPKIAAYWNELQSLGYPSNTQRKRFRSLPLQVQQELATQKWEDGQIYFNLTTQSYFLNRGGDICERNHGVFGDFFYYPITHHNFDYDYLTMLRMS